MTETKVFTDHFARNFSSAEDFLQFLAERKENSAWMTAPSKEIKFQSVERGTSQGDDYLKLFGLSGNEDVLADTMENTSLLLKLNGEDYPVRSCALKTILERARISGHALNKVSTNVFTQILNYCMDVASGTSLIKVADSKVSAVHGGDAKDYAVLEMLPLFRKVCDYLATEFPGNHFVTAHFDHSIAMAIWSLDGQADPIMDTYRRELVQRNLPATGIVPALRFMTSDVGMSGANLYPILLIGPAKRIVPLGYPIKTEHKYGSDMERFEEQLGLLFARFREAMEHQVKLMDIEIRYPQTTLMGVLKRIGAPKKNSYEVLDEFLATHGDTPCSAYELFMYMSEVIFNAQSEGASGIRIAQLEEIVARALHVNWHDYDRPGDFKW